MPSDQDIVSYAVYPGLGIARVGNSPEEYFIAAQVPGEVPPGPYKDAAGAVKRQAALFRIYGLNAAGQAVKEITAADAEIEWQVHIANRKAGWYQFNNAMDLGEYALASQFRNNSTTGSDRAQLIIDPGSRTVSGRDQRAPAFDTGEFMGTPVYLGELRTDSQGRLIVLGGRGHSASLGNAPATTFANNDGWHDDVSDGPVRATITIGGQTFEAEPGFVAITPPNFGQGLYSVVTMYDVVSDLFIREGRLPALAQIDFYRDIYPIFQRLSGCQWVNQGIYFLFGQNSPSDFTTPAMVAQLSSPAPEHRAVRERLFHWFLDPDGTASEPVQLPPFYGDAFGDFSDVHADGLFVTRTQYALLKQWAEGHFVTGHPVPVRPLHDLPIAEQPDAVTRAALEECLGGPFHPGIEMTWVMRQSSMWRVPFRLNVLPESQPVSDDYGPVLCPDVCIGPTGPLTASGPGSLTRWMGVPWQTDEASCLSGYTLTNYLPLPSFWAVRVPNEVLPSESYDRLMDEKLPRGQRLKHFDNRPFWLRDFNTGYTQRINAMVSSWDQVGIVAAHPGPPDHVSAELPAEIFVETGRYYSTPAMRKTDPTWQQVLIAENRVPAAEEEQPKAAATLLRAASAEVPPERRRRTFRRDQR